MTLRIAIIGDCSFFPTQAAYGSAAQGFGAMPGTSNGYGQAGFAQGGMSPYGQSTSNFQSGQKRDSGYDQVSWMPA